MNASTQDETATLRPAAKGDLSSIEHLLMTSSSPTSGVADALGSFLVAAAGDASARRPLGVEGPI